MNDTLIDARFSYCRNDQDKRLDDKLTSVRPLLAYEDLLHTQFVPQAWINSYPDAIAGVLRDHKSIPMHASYQPYDWLVSFSGCKGYFGEQTCEDLYNAFAKTTNGESSL